MREDAVAGRGVGDGVADDLADFEGAGLLEEEHREACVGYAGLGGVGARIIVVRSWRELVRGGRGGLVRGGCCV